MCIYVWCIHILIFMYIHIYIIFVSYMYTHIFMNLNMYGEHLIFRYWLNKRSWTSCQSNRESMYLLSVAPLRLVTRMQHVNACSLASDASVAPRTAYIWLHYVFVVRFCIFLLNVPCGLAAHSIAIAFCSFHAPPPRTIKPHRPSRLLAWALELVF